MASPRVRVLELGCGWGLVGIACAKLFQAQVTGLDADVAVFPYLQLHAQRNGVHIAPWHGSFADLTPPDLAAFELIVGADIFFWEALVDRHCQVNEKSLPDAFPLRKPEGVGIAKIQGLVQAQNPL